MPSELEASIYRVLAYMAYFSFPVTALEVAKWCDASGVSFAQIDDVLRTSSWLADHGVRGAEGFWGIGDVRSWRMERIFRMTDALRKSRRARLFASFARMLPWVRMVAVCNSLAHAFTSEASDIDLFIVTKRNRIWSTRLVLSGVLALMRLRPGETARDPICLSFFVDEDHLDLSSVTLSPDDPYFCYWITSLSPIFDRDDVFGKMWSMNRWSRASLPNVMPPLRTSKFCVHRSASFPDISWLEPWAERVQRSRFPASLRRKMNQSTHVVVNDGMLKFHEDDRREAIAQAWKIRCLEALV